MRKCFDKKMQFYTYFFIKMAIVDYRNTSMPLIWKMQTTTIATTMGL